MDERDRRSQHRSIGVILAVPLAWIAATGVAMQLVAVWASARPDYSELSVAHMREGPAGPHGFTDMAAPTVAARSIADANPRVAVVRAMKSLRAMHVDGSITGVEWRGLAGGDQIIFDFGRSPVRQMAFDVGSGRYIRNANLAFDNEPFPKRPSAYGALKALHQGRLMGPAGIALSIVVGLSAIALIVVGCGIYVDLYRRRRAMRRKGIFW